MSSKSSHHEAHEDSTDGGPRWKRVHHSWIFWVGVVITFAAILAYVFSIDLAIRPTPKAVQPTPSSTTDTR